MLPRPAQARAPTQIPGLWMSNTEPVIELASLPRDPTQAMRPIKLEVGVKAEAFLENAYQAENVSQHEAVDRKDFAAPPYQNFRWSSERR